MIPVNPRHPNSPSIRAKKIIEERKKQKLKKIVPIKQQQNSSSLSHSSPLPHSTSYSRLSHSSYPPPPSPLSLPSSNFQIHFFFSTPFHPIRYGFFHCFLCFSLICFLLIQPQTGSFLRSNCHFPFLSCFALQFLFSRGFIF